MGSAESLGFLVSLGFLGKAEDNPFPSVSFMAPLLKYLHEQQTFDILFGFENTV